jgi:hypothetical protein
MPILFKLGGRLGNAIFRYMACTIMCIYYNEKYDVSTESHNDKCVNFNDDAFNLMCKKIFDGIFPETQHKYTIHMIDYYQHDLIYCKHKHEIINFIKHNSDHFVLTDGINSGDGRHEKYFMIDILITPVLFTKKYKNVIHLRLDDFVTHNLFVDVNRIIRLIHRNIISDNLCIVCKKPVTDFEFKYINQLTDYLKYKKIDFNLEHNDTLTDYYIMKEAELLICSMSTLSWSAAFLSDKLKKCYVPDYEIKVNSSFKRPIDDTELY